MVSPWLLGKNLKVTAKKIETKQSKTKSLIISGIIEYEVFSSFSNLPCYLYLQRKRL